MAEVGIVADYRGRNRGAKVTTVAKASTVTQSLLEAHFPSTQRFILENVRVMKLLLKSVLGVLALLLLGTSLYGAKGYFDALSDSAQLVARADQLINSGKAGADLGSGRLEQLLRVQDPAYFDHSGIDL